MVYLSDLFSDLYASVKQIWGKAFTIKALIHVENTPLFNNRLIFTIHKAEIST